MTIIMVLVLFFFALLKSRLREQLSLGSRSNLLLDARRAGEEQQLCTRVVEERWGVDGNELGGEEGEKGFGELLVRSVPG